MFRSRSLTDEKDKYGYNSWDNVELEGEDLIKAIEKVNRDNSLPPKDTEKESTMKRWDIFYKNHKNLFFKPRNWLILEFPEIFSDSTQRILEIGCGTGSSLIHLQDTTKEIYACDFSINALTHAKKNSSSQITFFLHDITSTEELPYSNFDAILLIFTLSSIHPSFHQNIISKLSRSLSPNGKIYFKDYCHMDLAQLRFKPNQVLNKNLYKRGDGTLAYFFEVEEIHSLFSNNYFNVLSLFKDKRLLINRKKKLEMLRVWIQGIFCKEKNNELENRSIDNPVRKKLRGYLRMPSKGYKSDNIIRHILPNSYKKVIVSNIKDLEALTSLNRFYCAQIAHEVGAKKRIEIVCRANELDILVLNKDARLVSEGKE
ncbi:ribosomal protein L32 [Hamiltosporidium tvaerminnensis]|nr:ribosomal protein L32 [Hamiltosporidium magnivora]TBU00705.1 ribosomal protein L32 [Hamiltosporidium tvaerminnensis]